MSFDLRKKLFSNQFSFFSKKKLENRDYATPDEFATDVRLVFSNCYLYNRPDTDVVAMCKKVEVKLSLSRQTKGFESIFFSFSKCLKINMRNYPMNQQ